MVQALSGRTPAHLNQIGKINLGEWLCLCDGTHLRLTLWRLRDYNAGTQKS